MTATNKSLATSPLAGDPEGDMAIGSTVLLGRAGRVLREDKRAVLGVLIVGCFVVVALGAPLFAPYAVNEQSLVERLIPPAWTGGTWEHPLGTDNLGRDVLSRVIFGARNSLFVGLSVVVIAGMFGTVLGLVAGYRGGRTESAIMRLVDIQLAFPGLLIALVLLAFIGANPQTVVIVLAFNGWMIYATVVRGAVQSLASRPFVEAAVIGGAKARRVVFRHVLPNLAAPLTVLAVLEFARIMLAEASLSFLGFGIQPPDTSWGFDVATGREFVFSAWWLITFPGAALALSVLGMNFLGNWLRTNLDPEARDREFELSQRGGAVPNREEES